MGISLDSKLRIAGYRSAIFRDALRHFLRFQSPATMIDLKRILSLRRDGAIVFEECLDRGLIDRETYTLMEAGRAIAQAKARPRTPLAHAQAVLGELLDRIDRLNRDPDAIRLVDQVWLFGSVMRGEACVGDIDLALTVSRSLRFLDDLEGRRKHVEERLSRYESIPDHLGAQRAKEAWLLQRALYGTRRHALLAGAREDTLDLESLGTPCRLIYDRSRGGRVSDPVLPRHPESQGRSDDLGPPTEMPDFRPAPIRPMDARWVAGFRSTGEVSPYYIFRGWTHDAHALFPVYPEGLRVVGDDHDLSRYVWIPKRLQKSGLDGRSAVALINATPRAGTSIVLQRHIEAHANHWTLRVEFTDVQLLKRRSSVDLGSLPEIAATAALILAVDAEHMLRRAAELPIPPVVRINIDDASLGAELQACFAEPLRTCLESRTVRIEPVDEADRRALAIPKRSSH